MVDGSTLKSMPMVAVEESGSNSSSQYLVSTVHGISIPWVFVTSVSMTSLQADFPAPDGPIRSTLMVGKESSDAMGVKSKSEGRSLARFLFYCASSCTVRGRGAGLIK